MEAQQPFDQRGEVKSTNRVVSLLPRQQMAIVAAIDQLRFRVSAIGDAAVLIAVGSTLTWIADSDLDSQTRTMVEMLSASGLAREAVTCLPPAEEGDPLTNAGESMMSAPVALAAIPIRAYERTLVCSP